MGNNTELGIALSPLHDVFLDQIAPATGKRCQWNWPIPSIAFFPDSLEDEWRNEASMGVLNCPWSMDTSAGEDIFLGPWYPTWFHHWFSDVLLKGSIDSA